MDDVWAVQGTADLLLGYADAEMAGRVRARLGSAATVRTPSAPTPHTDPMAAATPQSASVLLSTLKRQPPREHRRILGGTRLGPQAWASILREHSEARLPGDVCDALVEHRDCPPAAALALLVTDRPHSASRALETALRRRLVTPRQVAMDAAPGWWAVVTLDSWGERTDGTVLAPIDTVLDEVAALLPRDAAALAWFLAHAPTYPGTFPQLCAEAAARGAERRDPNEPPGPDVFDVLNKHAASVAGSGSLWFRWGAARMLARADPATAAQVVEALPMAAIRGFQRAKGLPAHIIRAAIRRDGSLARALAATVRRDAEAAPALLALGDPDINGALLALEDVAGHSSDFGPPRYPAPDPDVVRAVFEATRCDATPKPVPLADSARRLLTSDVAWMRDRSAEAVHGHDPKLIRFALATLPRRLGTAGTLRGLLSLWECEGPHAMANTRLAPDSLHRHVMEALTREPDGLTWLRTEVARHEAPAALLAAVRDEPLVAKRALPEDFWAEAVASHARSPLPAAAMTNLATHAACPPELLLPACAHNPALAATLAGRSREHALAALRHPLPAPVRPSHAGVKATAPWYLAALTYGRVTVGEFVEHAHPASELLAACDRMAPLLPDEYEMARVLITERAARTLGDNPEGWAVAARLAPEHHGTLPELLATAAAATGRGDGAPAH